MYVELHDSFKDPIRVPATRVVVYDELRNPISVVFQLGNNQYLASHAGNKNFQQILDMLGVKKTVIVDTIGPEDLNPPNLN